MPDRRPPLPRTRNPDRAQAAPHLPHHPNLLALRHLRHSRLWSESQRVFRLQYLLLPKIPSSWLDIKVMPFLLKHLCLQFDGHLFFAMCKLQLTILKLKSRTFR